MTSFLAALQFLTIVPIRLERIAQKDIAHALTYFPCAGLIIGLWCVLVEVCLDGLGFSRIATGMLVIVFLAVVTGAMHLDGLADTADALFSRKDRDSMLAIMRDPHLGTGGTVAVVCLLLAKTACLVTIPQQIEASVLILMCVVSRWVLVLLMRGFPYARREGTASAFIGTMGYKGIFFSTLITAYLAWCVLGVPGLVLAASSAGCAVIIAAYAGRKFGGITGDVLGAALELTEVFVLFSAPIVTAVLA